MLFRWQADAQRGLPKVCSRPQLRGRRRRLSRTLIGQVNMMRQRLCRSNFSPSTKYSSASHVETNDFAENTHISLHIGLQKLVLNLLSASLMRASHSKSSAEEPDIIYSMRFGTQLSPRLDAQVLIGHKFPVASPRKDVGRHRRSRTLRRNDGRARGAPVKCGSGEEGAASFCSRRSDDANESNNGQRA